MRLRTFGLGSGLGLSVLLALLLTGCGVTINKNPPAALAVTTTSLTAGTINTAYNASLTASGGTLPYSWSLASGTLPAGLSLSAAGVISGTPTATGSSSITVKVTDSEPTPASATASLTLAISSPKLTITTATLPAGTENLAYSTSLAATGGVAPYTWTLSGGALQTGLTLIAAGVISGTPTAVGTSSLTIQVADAESTPQTATATLSLTIDPAKLVITTTSLPTGQVGTAYDATLAASGGVPPYTWSVAATGPQLPSGIVLSAAGVLSGTPTASSSTSPVFVVADAEATPQTAMAALPLIIDPASTHLTDSRYAFVFSGNGPKGALAIDGTFVVSQGAVVSGTYDENAAGSAPLTGSVSGGTVTTGNGLGQLELTLDGTSVTFHFAAPVSGADIRLIEFDDKDGTGTRGSGLLKLAAAQPSTALTAGSYAFGVSGSDPGAANALASIIGSIKTDAHGAVSGGNAYQCLAGTPASALSNITGSYSIASSTYRGQLTLNLNGGTFHYAFYQVSPSELMAITIDNTASTPLASGSLLLQSTSAFNTFLGATSVLELNGQVIGGKTADVTLGLFAFNGKNGVSITNDEYNGALLPPQSFTGSTYTLADGSTGWVTVNDSAGKRLYDLYVIDGTSAFVQAAGTSASSGLLEAQTGTAFDAAKSYFGGTLALPGPAADNRVSVVSLNTGSLSIVSDISGPAGLQTAQALTGTYTVGANGRAVVTAADGAPRIFYIVSPTKTILLSGESGGFLGSYEQ